MDARQLAGIRAREQALPNSEPWVFEPQDFSVWEGLGECRQIAHCQSVPGAGMIHDKAELRAIGIFIADARADVPALLDEVARLQALVAELTTCECGRQLSSGRCGVCDRDE